jgi:outer membrane protein assembly factor BamB
MLRSCLVAVGLAAVIFAAATVRAGDWPQWRGPNLTDVTDDSSGWAPGATPEKIWTAKVGSGCTSPIIAAGKVYTMGWQNGADAVFCFDLRTGKELWKQSYPAKERARTHHYDEQQYSGPLATPTFDAATGYLYTLGVDGDLKCWDTAKEGAPVWGKNLFTDLKATGRPDRDYGFTGCPLLLGDLILCEACAPGGTVTAFDKKTAAIRWASEYKGPSGHTGGAAVMTAGGNPCLVYLTDKDVVVMRTDKGNEGKTVATVPWTTTYDQNIPTPATSGNLVFITTSFNHESGMVCYELTDGGLKQKWLAKGAFSKICSPIVYKDSVFFVEGSLKCVDIATGATRWKGGSFGSGSCLVTAGDNKLIVFGSGRVSLFDAGAADYKELAKIDTGLTDTCYPHVALSDGILVVKDKGGTMLAFKVGK